MREMIIALRTQTPIWLGDVDRDCTRAKESGILGSLRHWLIEMCRHRGIAVCEDTQGLPCQEVTKSKKPDLDRLCLVCRIFGSSGYARSFRLDVEDLAVTPLYFLCFPGRIETSGWWLRKSFMGGNGTSLQRSAFWNSPQVGFKLRFTLTLNGQPDTLPTLAAVLLNMQRYGAIGAKAQNGFGAFGLVGPTITTLQSSARSATQLGAPPSDRFLALKFQVEPARLHGIDWEMIGAHDAADPEPYYPCAFDLRVRLKTILEALTGGAQLVGSSDEAGRVFINHPYRVDDVYRFRAWSNLPKSVDAGNARDAIVKTFADELGAIVIPS